MSRDLAARGHQVTSLDASPSLVRAAAELDPDGDYVVGSAEALPFADATFGLVVAYNVLMDVEDMPRALLEAARVLAANGRLGLCVTHPFADAGDWEDDGDDARFIMAGSYLDGGPFQATIEKSGLTMTFDGMAHSVEKYSRALEAGGLLIEAIREAAPVAGRLAGSRWARLPMFLMLRAVKP